MSRHTIQLDIENLACSRGGRQIFESVSFSLSSGQGILLKGPNGAGKTTLLKVLAGFIPSSSGKINFDTACLNEEVSFAEQCHYIGHLNGIKKIFTVQENLEFMKAYLASSLSPVAGAELSIAKKTTEQTLEIFALSHLRDIPAGYLSAGQKRRVALARLILVPRLIWLLDEPTVSLDQTSQELLSGMMQEHLSGGGMIIAVSHIPLGIDFDQTLRFSKGRLQKEKPI